MGNPAGGVHKDWAKLKEQSTGEKRKEMFSWSHQDRRSKLASVYDHVFVVNSSQWAGKTRKTMFTNYT